MNFEIGETIATRTLHITLEDGTRRAVLVILGKPKQFPDSSDYYVPFKITGIGSESVLCAGGIDAFQALQQVMPIINAQLLALKATYAGNLVWEGDQEGGFGFSTA
jgi:hypothetical protein